MTDRCSAVITFHTQGLADRAWACELPADHESIHVAESTISPICWFAPDVWEAT